MNDYLEDQEAYARMAKLQNVYGHGNTKKE